MTAMESDFGITLNGSKGSLSGRVGGNPGKDHSVTVLCQKPTSVTPTKAATESWSDMLRLLPAKSLYIKPRAYGGGLLALLNLIS
jgi:hypothetical protein